MSKKYKIGFARPALLQETVLVAQCFCDLREWALVKQKIKQENLLQCRTERSSDIITSEIVTRLSLLIEGQIELLAEDETQNVRQLVWIAWNIPDTSIRW